MIDVALAQAAGPASACATRAPDSASGSNAGAQDFAAVLCATVQETQPAGQESTPTGQSTDAGASAGSGAAVVDTLLAQFLAQLPPQAACEGGQPDTEVVQAIDMPAAPATAGTTATETLSPAVPMAAPLASQDGAAYPWIDADQEVQDVEVIAVGPAAQDAPAAPSAGGEEVVAVTTGTAAGNEALAALLKRTGGTDAARATQMLDRADAGNPEVLGSGVPSKLPSLLEADPDSKKPGRPQDEAPGNEGGRQADDASAERLRLNLASRTDAVVGEALRTAVVDQSAQASMDVSPGVAVSATAPAADRAVPLTTSGRQEAQPLPDPALHERVIEQVVREVRLTRLPDRSDLVVRLNPPELGTLRVHITQDAQGISSQITASTEQVRHLLQSHVPVLVEALAQAGVRMDSVSVTSDVSFGAFMNSSAQGSDYQQAGGQPRGSSQSGPMFDAAMLAGSLPTAAPDSAAYNWLA